MTSLRQCAAPAAEIALLDQIVTASQVATELGLGRMHWEAIYTWNELPPDFESPQALAYDKAVADLLDMTDALLVMRANRGASS